MNNEPVYGNHIGVVVSNEDPEGRNRVQVFVPYVSTTLFDDWNAKQVDIEIGPGTFDKIDAKILARLKLNLPWAEAALPTFGGNGSVSYNKNQEANVIRSPVNSASPPSKPIVDVDPSGTQIIKPSTTVSGGVLNSTPSSKSSITDISQINENVLKGLYGLGMAETGFNSSEANSNKSNSYRNLISVGGSEPFEVPALGPYKKMPGLKILEVKNSNVATEYKKNGGDLVAAQKIYGDYGVFQLNSTDNQQAGVTLNSGTAEEQFIKVNNFIKETFPSAYNQMASGDYKSAYKQLNGKWPSLKSDAEVSTSGLNKALNNTATDSNTIINKVKNAGTASENSTTNSVVASSFKPLQLDPSVPIAQGAYNNITTPGGVHSKPQIGTMVWVFFYGGDTMRPVYFAGVSEPQSIGRSAG